MKNFSSFFLLLALALPMAGQVSVTKTSGTNVVSNGPIVIGAGNSLSATGGGTITATAVPNTAVTPGSYTNTSLTVGADGRITAASNGSAGAGTVTSVAATVPSFLSISGSPVTTSGTLAITYSGTALPVANGGTGNTTGNAATVTTNANLTGPITSTGNATAIASQTGTGTKFVMDTSPTLVTPNIGVATATSVNGNTITTGTGTLTLGSATLNAGAGGTLGSNAFTSTAYVPTSTTVNGHALSSNVTVTASDVGLGSVTNDAQTKAAIVPNTAPSAGQILVGNAGGTAYAPVSPSGDATLSSTGAITLSTVASAGTTGSSTAIPVITIDAKGRTTGITTAAVVAPAGTLTGTTLASNVVNSSLTGAAGGAFGTAAYTASSAYATAAQGTKADNVAAVTGAIKSNGSGTFSQAAASDLSNGTTGTGAVVLASAIPTVPTSANPSASVGLTAVNGSASTFMRSDGAPALSVAIAPTWTGPHVWSVSGATTGLSQSISATSTSTTSGVGGTTVRAALLNATTGATTVDFTGGSTTAPNGGVYAARFISNHTGSGTVTFQRGISAGPSVTGGNATNVLGYMAEAPSIASGKTATNWTQYYAVGNSASVAGTLGTYIGFYSEACTAGSTANWGFYDPSNANYFGGRLQIGSTTNHSSEQLQVTGTAYVSSDLTVGGTINGTLNGGATSAASVGVDIDSTNASYYPTLVSNTGGNFAVKVASTLRFNPSTGVITANSFNGDLTGNAATSTASAITSDTTTNDDLPLVFVSTSGGTRALKVTDGDVMGWNPSSGVLFAPAMSADTFSGDISGNVEAIHISGGGSAPTIDAGTGAGTGPTVSVSGHDTAFKISVTTGTLPTLSGVICTVTFDSSFASAPHFSLTPSDGTAVALSAATSVIPSSTTTTFVLTAGPTALTGSTTYTWEVICIQ